MGKLDPSFTTTVHSIPHMRNTGNPVFFDSKGQMGQKRRKISRYDDGQRVLILRIARGGTKSGFRGCRKPLRDTSLTDLKQQMRERFDALTPGWPLPTARIQRNGLSDFNSHSVLFPSHSESCPTHRMHAQAAARFLFALP
jgi:hypothetical protein